MVDSGRPRSDPDRSRRGTRVASQLWDVVVRSDIFYQAGAIAFNVFVAVIPAALLIAGIAGFVANARFGSTLPDLTDFLLSYFPAAPISGDVADTARELLEELMAQRAPLSLIGGIVLLWLSTRLATCLRITLRQVFEVENGRGIVEGKIFDGGVVLVVGLLLPVNLGITIALEALEGSGAAFVGSDQAHLLRSIAGIMASVVSAWVLFFLLYWRLPARSVPFRSAAAGATFAGIGYEVMKAGFTVYVRSFGGPPGGYGTLGVIAIFFFWVYYSAIVFILGGQVARIHEIRRGGMGATTSTERGNRGRGADMALPLFVLGALTFGVPSVAMGQSIAPFGGNGTLPGFLATSEGVVFADQSLERNLTLERPLVETDGAYIVVHVAESRVLLIEGTEVIWSAPAGTGTGFQLEGQGRSWTFTTPVGMFRVLRKEKDPVWIAPDWYYIEQGLPIPPSAQRLRSATTLGNTALFLGDGIAIHGTNRPELLLDPDPDTRRVSHGCIRLTNEAARELYHRVEVGTPVLIF